jgi:hypothetical protein
MHNNILLFHQEKKIEIEFKSPRSFVSKTVSVYIKFSTTRRKKQKSGKKREVQHKNEPHATQQQHNEHTYIDKYMCVQIRSPITINFSS